MESGREGQNISDVKKRVNCVQKKTKATKTHFILVFFKGIFDDENLSQTMRNILSLTLMHFNFVFRSRERFQYGWEFTLHIFSESRICTPKLQISWELFGH